MNTPYIMSERSLTAFIDGRSYTVDNTHANWDKIVLAVKHEQFDAIPKLIDLGKAITEFGEGHYVSVKGGVVYYKDKPVHNTLTKRILDMMTQGFDVLPIVTFMDRLHDNPSYRAIQELYLFLETNDLPITSDGHFLAWKKVSHDYKDIHSGRFDNSVGCVCEMPRQEVDDERDNTCSNGLHFCSESYLEHYGWSNDCKVVVVKINPKDVVSIPSDYANAKGRCSRYEVILDQGDFEHKDVAVYIESDLPGPDRCFDPGDGHSLCGDYEWEHEVELDCDNCKANQ